MCVHSHSTRFSAFFLRIACLIFSLCSVVFGPEPPRFELLVRVTGVEPVRTWRQILSLLGLPIPPYSHHMAGPFPFLKPTSPPSSLIRFTTSSKRIGLKSVCSTQTQ